jgi:hypothetical protein
VQYGLAEGRPVVRSVPLGRQHDDRPAVAPTPELLHDPDRREPGAGDNDPAAGTEGGHEASLRAVMKRA